VAVASAPAHGPAVAWGSAITYTPTADYAGPDSFIYTTFLGFSEDDVRQRSDFTGLGKLYRCG